MSHTQPDYYSYVLQLRRADNAGWPNWWACLQSTTGGECHNFANLDGMLTFLGTQTGQPVSSSNALAAAALVECLQAGNAQASVHLARLLQADHGQALLPLLSLAARQLGMPAEAIYHALSQAARDCCPLPETGAAPTPPQDESETARQDLARLLRAEGALRHHNRELALFNRALHALNSSLDLDQVLSITLQEACHILSTLTAQAWLIAPDTGELVCRQAIGPHGEAMRGQRLAPGTGLAGWVLHSGHGLIVPDAWDDPHCPADDRSGSPLRSILGAPLRVKQDLIGVLQVADTSPNRFDLNDLALLESLATSAAIVIDNARLVEALGQRTAELERQNEELDAFAQTVAHDIKSPLGVIIGFGQLLAKDHAALPLAELLSGLQAIINSGCKIAAIVDALLLLAGVRKMGSAQACPLDMAAIVGEACQRLAPLINDHQAEITAPATWPSALGYAPWIEEVWVNYLSNAVKYGGRPPRIELGFTQLLPPGTDDLAPQPAIKFWVRDDGPGLAPEQQKRLFTPFTRLHRDRAEGYGLGLSIVQRIIEKLGGQVGVESQPGQGSLFYFTLPAAK